MVDPMEVDTLTPIVGEDACEVCSCEEDCDDCDDAEIPLLLGRAISLKLYHFLNVCTNKCFSRKKVY